jgi:tetraacyldisaccharide 4'-kinase
LHNPEGASFYGDEPWMLAKLHPMVKVYVGPQKYRSLLFAENTDDLDCYVIDDGFQHRAIHRDLDIVLVDASAALAEKELIPAGRAREKMSSLRRADIVILSKINFSNEENLTKWRQYVDSEFSGLVVEANYKMDIPDITNLKVLVISGIAKPSVLKAEIAGRCTDFEMMNFPDHYQYTEKDVQEIVNKAAKFDLVLTTSKDQVKLSGFSSIANLKVIGLKVEFTKGGNEFYDKLDQIWC